MHISLTDPDFGYYTTKRNIFHKGGDFSTSPEFRQLFGEVFSYMIKAYWDMD